MLAPIRYHRVTARFGEVAERRRVAGRQWRLQFEDVPRVNPGLHRYPLLVLVAGLLVTSLLYGILLTLSRTRADEVRISMP